MRTTLTSRPRLPVALPLAAAGLLAAGGWFHWCLYRHGYRYIPTIGPLFMLNALSSLDNLKLDYDDENTGVGILRRALEAPMRKIAANAGQDGAVIIQSVRRAQADRKDEKIGYDVISGQFVNMIEAGIIDPAKVTRGALENAASIASMILTTEALITDIKEPEKAPAMPPGGGMDY